MITTDTKTLIENEFTNLDLGDERLNKRAKLIAGSINCNPEKSLPAISNGNDSQLKAIYRFFQNERVNEANILATHYTNTALRMFHYSGKILLLNDSCFVTPTKSMEGLLTRGKGKDNCVRTHYALAVSEDGVHIFGILDFSILAGPISERHPELKDESDIWLQTADRCVQRINAVCPNKTLLKRCLFISDREGDEFELMANLQKLELGFIIRSQYDRKIIFDEVDDKLFEALSHAKKHGQPYTIKTKDESKIVKIEVERSVLRNITIIPPAKNKDLSPIEIDMVEVRSCLSSSVNISWRLWTTEEISTVDQSASIVSYYAHRWKIEEVNKAAKTGVRIEDRQFTELEHFMPFVSMAFVIAWRIVAVRTITDASPDGEISTGFTKEEESYLKAEAKKMKLEMNTISDAIYLISKLGGFTDRYEKAGWQILWQGWMRFYERVEGFILARNSE